MSGDEERSQPSGEACPPSLGGNEAEVQALGSNIFDSPGYSGRLCRSRMPEETQPITTRWAFWKEAFWRPAGALVVIPYTLWGLLAFVRDEIIQPQRVELWKPIYWLSKLPWYVWLIATLAIAVVVAVEGSFRAMHTRDIAMATLRNRLEPKFSVEYDADSSLVFPEGETYRILVRNTGLMTIDDVVVRIVSIPTAPHLNGFLPFTLREQHTASGGPFTLNQDAPLHIDFLEWSEHTSAQVNRAGLQFILFCHARNSFGGGGLQHEGVNFIRVQVQGRNVPSHYQDFRVMSRLAEHKASGGGSLTIEPVTLLADASSARA